MKYWDASAVVPLLVAEPTTRVMRDQVMRDSAMITWWGTRVECVSALTRQARDGALTEAQVAEAIARLDALGHAWAEVLPTEPVRRTAIRSLRSHSMRSADALQLAAAIVSAEGDPGSLPFVTLDARLAEVAAKEGFPLVTA